MVNDLTPKEMFEIVSLQMEREVNLSHKRMTWLLTFQGFLFTAFSIAIRSPTDPILKYSVLVMIPIAGVRVANLGLGGLVASQKMRDDLKQFWEKQPYWLQLPRFYSEPNVSTQGRSTSLGIVRIIRVIWIVFLAIAICQIAISLAT
ncbi:MAG: hypothetical protein AAGI69_30935 [Cyanobacteria bacterium P01_H01_bin.21]